MPRLTILTDKEQLEFDCPPTLNVEARAVCFAIDEIMEVTHSTVLIDIVEVQKIVELLKKYADEENKKEQKKLRNLKSH